MNPPLRVLSSLALVSMLEALRSAFEAETGRVLDLLLQPTALLLPLIRQGSRGDAVILTAAGIDALCADGTAAPHTRRDLAVSCVGIAVRAGAPRPPIGTEAELVAALRAARSVGLSRAGASGLYFEGLLERLGLAAEVKAKATVIESGYTGALAADGRVELAVQQVSELLMVPGIDVLGPLPAGLGAETMFAGAVFTGAGTPDAAEKLLAAIAGAGPLLRKHGLAPT